MSAPIRPVLRWHGGKWRLAPWIISHFPPHRIYVEPFGGAASVLLRKARSHAEVYNDLDSEAVNLFRVLRDEVAARRLSELLALTPFARDEFLGSYAMSGDPVEDARRFVCRSFMGYGSNAACTTLGGRAQTGFRSNSNRSGTVPAREWTGLPTALSATIERLRGVIVENRDALDVMAAHDDAATLHYVDPPYLHALRSPANPYDLKHFYRHELSDGDHAALLAFLRNLAGFVVLSGYGSHLYDTALPEWRRVETVALADGARERTEILWLNPACAQALEHRARGGRHAAVCKDGGGCRVSDPVTAFGLFVLSLFRRGPAAAGPPAGPMADRCCGAEVDPLAELRRELAAEIERQDREARRG